MDVSSDSVLCDELFSWLAPADLEMLVNCFDMEQDALAKGDRRESSGRLGYLLAGEGSLSRDGERATVQQGAFFGAAAAMEGTVYAGEVEFAADGDCQILWMGREILTSVCYRACWFHGRFVMEANARMERQTGQ